MLKKDNRYRILGIFFDDPSPKGIGFQLREISRKVGIAPTSVKNYLGELEGDELVIKVKHRIHGYPVYYANRDNENFKLLKRLDMIIKIKESGLLDYLSETCMPDVIVLFGSSAHGEDLKDSDVDLFLMAKEEKIILDKFEKRLSRRVHVFFGEDFNKLSKELRNNIINGVILKGYLKVF
ncbi:MAG: nucleotidyltransferase domain-containing protein [Candidatus Aenigmarchaeota archaeon]|nr:nucleotidyltransferase domain-containing protein [Candidatus Aenigmarchaeota archaeon]